MANVLSDEKRQQSEALGRLGVLGCDVGSLFFTTHTRRTARLPSWAEAPTIAPGMRLASPGRGYAGRPELVRRTHRRRHGGSAMPSTSRHSGEPPNWRMISS